MDTLLLRLRGDLALFAPVRWRSGDARVDYDGTSSLGHLVESVGVPLTEVGSLLIGGRRVPPSHRVSAGDEVEVLPVTRPQRFGTTQLRFLLDVHLGKLARRLRLLGLDAAYRTDADDDDLVSTASRERRILLTKDRALLMRRALPMGAFVRGSAADDQLADVLDRFDPPISPYQRCPRCNGTLAPVDKTVIAHRLEAGTRRSYDDYAACRGCGQVYWRGAHSSRLDAVVESARRTRS